MAPVKSPKLRRHVATRPADPGTVSIGRVDVVSQTAAVLPHRLRGRRRASSACSSGRGLRVWVLEVWGHVAEKLDDTCWIRLKRRVETAASNESPIVASHRTASTSSGRRSTSSRGVRGHRALPTQRKAYRNDATALGSFRGGPGRRLCVKTAGESCMEIRTRTTQSRCTIRRRPAAMPLGLENLMCLCR